MEIPQILMSLRSDLKTLVQLKSVDEQRKNMFRKSGQMPRPRIGQSSPWELMNGLSREEVAFVDEVAARSRRAWAQDDKRGLFS